MTTGDYTSMMSTMSALQTFQSGTILADKTQYELIRTSADFRKALMKPLLASESATKLTQMKDTPYMDLAKKCKDAGSYDMFTKGPEAIVSMFTKDSGTNWTHANKASMVESAFQMLQETDFSTMTDKDDLKNLGSILGGTVL